jgi:hypothetical protein
LVLVDLELKEGPDAAEAAEADAAAADAAEVLLLRG